MSREGENPPQRGSNELFRGRSASRGRCGRIPRYRIVSCAVFSEISRNERQRGRCKSAKSPAAGHGARGPLLAFCEKGATRPDYRSSGPSPQPGLAKPIGTSETCGGFRPRRCGFFGRGTRISTGQPTGSSANKRSSRPRWPSIRCGDSCADKARDASEMEARGAEQRRHTGR